MSAVLVGILCGIYLGYVQTYPYVLEVYAEEKVDEPQEVKIEVVIDWNRDRIEKELRDTFKEDPETAVRIAKCESGMRADIQSHHVRNGQQEESFGVMQIHAPSWHQKAIALGYEDYRTDPGDNIAMARYIYDNAGGRWNDWSCYTKKMI